MPDIFLIRVRIRNLGHVHADQDGQTEDDGRVEQRPRADKHLSLLGRVERPGPHLARPEVLDRGIDASLPAVPIRMLLLP